MKKKIRYVLMVVCIAVFCYSAYNLINIYFDYKEIDDKYGDIAEEYSTEEDEGAVHRQSWRTVLTR